MKKNVELLLEYEQEEVTFEDGDILVLLNAISSINSVLLPYIDLLIEKLDNEAKEISAITTWTLSVTIFLTLIIAVAAVNLSKTAKKEQQ